MVSTSLRFGNLLKPNNGFVWKYFCTVIAMLDDIPIIVNKALNIRISRIKHGSHDGGGHWIFGFDLQ